MVWSLWTCTEKHHKVLVFKVYAQKYIDIVHAFLKALGEVFKFQNIFIYFVIAKNRLIAHVMTSQFFKICVSDEQRESKSLQEQRRFQCTLMVVLNGNYLKTSFSKKPSVSVCAKR